jgi:predicted nucleic acid-binding protein
VKRVFVDSGAFFAHVVAEDAFHSAALDLFQQAEAKDWRLLTSNAVVFESYALFLSRARNGRALAIGFQDDISAGLCRVERLTKGDETRAHALVRAHHDKEYSLCDASTFVAMSRLRIRDAISFDGHFRQYGQFTVL